MCICICMYRHKVPLRSLSFIAQHFSVYFPINTGTKCLRHWGPGLEQRESFNASPFISFESFTLFFYLTVSYIYITDINCFQCLTTPQPCLSLEPFSASSPPMLMTSFCVRPTEFHQSFQPEVRWEDFTGTGTTYQGLHYRQN